MSKEFDTKHDYIWLFFKGLAMGAADVVPGVSGGTIAFITGTYMRLIRAISQFNLKSVHLLKGTEWSAFWRHIDGTFLFVLFGGIITSIVTLVRFVTYMLEHYPMLLWSFFFGLLVASFIHLCKKVTTWELSTLSSCILGAIIAYLITSLSTLEVQAAPWLYFLSGAIAICAMILPGISGSLILLSMGMYGNILGAVNDFNLGLIALFLAGCICGLILFSRLLLWILNYYEQMTFALLSGFLLGSLNQLWPWKHVLSTYTNSKGEVKPLLKENVFPTEYIQITSLDAQVLECILLMLVGLFLVLSIERFCRKV